MNKLLAVFMLLCCSVVWAETNPTLTVGTVASQTGANPNRTIRVVTEVFPPFQTKKDGGPSGPMVSIMALICEKAKVVCIIESLPWREALALAEDGKADILFSILMAPEREEKFILSPPIAKTAYSFFVTAASNWSYTGKISDLDNRSFGVYGPSGTSLAAIELIRQNESARLTIEPSNLIAFQNLVLGKYGDKAAIVANKDVGLALIAEKNISGPKLAGDIKQVYYGFGISRASPNADIARDFIRVTYELKKRGILQQILILNPQPITPSE